MLRWYLIYTLYTSWNKDSNNTITALGIFFNCQPLKIKKWITHDSNSVRFVQQRFIRYSCTSTTCNDGLSKQLGIHAVKRTHCDETEVSARRTITHVAETVDWSLQYNLLSDIETEHRLSDLRICPHDKRPCSIENNTWSIVVCIGDSNCKCHRTGQWWRACKYIQVRIYLLYINENHVNSNISNIEIKMMKLGNSLIETSTKQTCILTNYWAKDEATANIKPRL